MPLLTPAQQLRNEEQISLLSDKINRLVAEAEQQGTEGKVEQAQGLMKLCDQLKEEREQLRRQVENSHWQQTAEMAAAQEKQMEVCEICGAFLIVGDAQQRIDDHLMGKQHMGYARLKVTVEEIMDNRQKVKEERDKKREEERRERERQRAEEERKREREREERDRDRDKRWRKDEPLGEKGHLSASSARRGGSNRRSSRSRSRDRDRGRDRDRERGHRDSSRRHSRSPSKNKQRRRSRSRSQSRRKKRSNSRDRDRHHKDRRNTNGERRPFGPSPSRFGEGGVSSSSADVATRLMQLANGGLDDSSGGGGWGSAGQSTSE